MTDTGALLASHIDVAITKKFKTYARNPLGKVISEAK